MRGFNVVACMGCDDLHAVGFLCAILFFMFDFIFILNVRGL